MTASLHSRPSDKGARNGRALALVTAAVALGAIAAVACGDSTSDNLLGGSSGGGSSGGSVADGGGTVDPGDGSLLDPDGGNATALKLAERLYRDLEPDLKTACGGNACHEGSTSAPLWLQPPDSYVSIKKYDASQVGDKKLIVKDTLQSRLFTKGQHTGGALVTPDGTGNLGDKVKKWLDVEAAALAGAKLPSTTPITIVAGGANTVDLGTVPGGIAGAQITFNATISGKILALSSVKLVAPASSGIHIVHPIFVQVPADTTAKSLEDPGDQGSNVDDAAGAGKSIAVGPGTFLLTGFNWQATDKLQVEFAKVEAGTVAGGGGDGGTGGGCQNLAGFKAIEGFFKGGNGITPNCTAGCHKAGGGGDGALDLNALVTTPVDDSAACNQALTKVNKANKAQSAIILHPTGQSGNHGGGTVSDVTGYTNAVMSWLAGE
jgi:hypothetical protein